VIPLQEKRDDTRITMSDAGDEPSGGERPRKNTCVVEELLPDGGMVLYNSCRQQLMTLNPTAALVWECCDGAHSLAMIAQELRDVFPDAPTIAGDVLAVLQEFIGRAMIVDDNL
jgi:Coenzyme PQQ synthesis protein D (PqqD)